MNWLDFAVIGVIVLSAVFAFARGFVREALSIVAWVGAGWITFKGFAWVYAVVEPRVHERLLAQLVAGLGLFVASLIVLTILTGYLARMVRFSVLSPIDHTLGFIFGLLRGAFLVCLAFLLLILSVPQRSEWPPWIRDARSTRYLNDGAGVLDGFLPESLKHKGAEAYNRLLGPQPTAAEQAKAASRALVNPAPAAAPGAAPPPRYPASDRREMNRLNGLIDSKAH
jgi:membrane protein required for colicin V production